MPYHIVQYGSDGNEYREVVNLVTNVLVATGDTTSSYFPYVSTTVSYSYEGLATNRAKATQFVYDPATGNLTKRSDLGEVTPDSSVTNLTLLTGNQVYSFTQYTNFTGAAANVVNRPSSVKVCSDSAGSTQLRLTTFGYDSNARLTSVNKWIGGSTYATQTWGNYDAYGNPGSVTGPDGITSLITYDSAYAMFPTQRVTSTFVTKASFDVRSGRTHLDRRQRPYHGNLL
jgi:YD repeat-containing protein